MPPLDHAAAHERLADLALEAGGLAALGSPGEDPLAEHIAGCATCRRDLAALRRTHDRLREAMGEGSDRIALGSLADDEPIAPPLAIREHLLDVARSSRRSRPPAVVVTSPDVTPAPAVVGRAPARPRGARRWLPLAAALAIVAIGTGALIDRQSRLDTNARDLALLTGLGETTDRLLRDPNHRVVDLLGADGTVQGSLSWSSHDLVVLASTLQPAPAGREYRCWIERDGVRSPVGRMWFAGELAFWNGSLDDWAETSFAGGGTFGVSLEPIDGPGGNPAVLVADLGS